MNNGMTQIDWRSAKDDKNLVGLKHQLF